MLFPQGFLREQPFDQPQVESQKMSVKSGTHEIHSGVVAERIKDRRIRGKKLDERSQ